MSPQPEQRLLESAGGEQPFHEQPSQDLRPPPKAESQQSSGLTSPQSEQQILDTEVSQKSSRSSLQADEPPSAIPEVQKFSISSTDQAETEVRTGQQPSTSSPPPEPEKPTAEQRTPQTGTQPETSIERMRYIHALAWAIKYPGFPFFSTGDPLTDRALHFHEWHGMVIRQVAASVNEGKKIEEEPREKVKAYEKEMKKVETELKWHKHRLGVKAQELKILQELQEPVQSPYPSFPNWEPLRVMMDSEARKLASDRKEFSRIYKESASKTRKMRLDMLNAEDDASDVAELNEAWEMKLTELRNEQQDILLKLSKWQSDALSTNPFPTSSNDPALSRLRNHAEGLTAWFMERYKNDITVGPVAAKGDFKAVERAQKYARGLLEGIEQAWREGLEAESADARQIVDECVEEEMRAEGFRMPKATDG